MKRILVVDDEPDVVEHLVEVLAHAGWQTGSAGDGVDAVISVLDNRWDLVLMDIRMPRLNGVDALRIMKRANPSLPVIMFTGQAGQGDMAESARLGAFTCLLKPVSTAKLLETVRQALRF
jgi:two-component system response regulator AtoC